MCVCVKKGCRTLTGRFVLVPPTCSFFLFYWRATPLCVGRVSSSPAKCATGGSDCASVFDRRSRRTSAVQSPRPSPSELCPQLLQRHWCATSAEPPSPPRTPWRHTGRRTQVRRAAFANKRNVAVTTISLPPHHHFAAPAWSKQLMWQKKINI